MTLAEAHIILQARLRGLTQNAVAAVWTSLPAHNHENVDEWLTKVLPIVAAAQRHSVAITEAYLARALRRQPIGVHAQDLIGAAVRNGTPPEKVYERPFIQTWTDLGAGKTLDVALAAGLARAVSSAAMDVQLSMRATLGAVGAGDEQIVGYRRVADGGACDLCAAADGEFITDGSDFALHNNCGCGADPVMAGSHTPDDTTLGDIAVVHEHGELGPMLVKAGDHFTTEHQLH